MTLTNKQYREHVAIHAGFIAATTNHLRCTANKHIVLEGTHGMRIEIEAGETFYLFRAASLGEDMFYLVLTDRFGVKRCSCPANKPCKHEIALRPIINARRPKSAEPGDEDYSDLIDNNNHSQVIHGPDWCLDLRPATKPVEDKVPGKLNGVQTSGGFLNAVFGNSAAMTQHRARYTAR